MTSFLLKRLLALVPVLLGASFIVFSIMHLTPGDPAVLLLPQDASAEDIAVMRESLGLNRPFLVQYGSFLQGILRGDLGTSFRSGQPVAGLIMSRLPATMQLAAASLIVAIIIGLVAGIVAAVRQYTLWDGGAMVTALLGVSMPNFWLGLMLILFFSVFWAGRFGSVLLPASGYGTIQHMIMPAIVLGTAHAAFVTRITRSSMLEVLRQDYIRMARAKGLSPFRVVAIHALRNALLPVVTIVGLRFGVLLGGSVVTERIFAWPGIGRLLIDAVRAQDYAVVQGIILTYAIIFSLVTLGVDLIYGLVDPRIRSQYR
ncbi:ABC transporter permease [Alkalispirochaeta alkalica]|uniref:ABC transporter permease n=1 Tax=Alkalispirochaeta alkalica TaxID=46356 RepID=UPI00036BEC4C|nr:ABC transporter permease [Alkalispirochaeta alkalica]